MTSAPVPAQNKTMVLRRWAPLAILVGLGVLAYALKLHHYLTFQALLENHEALQAYVRDNVFTALLAYALLYIAVVGLSLPGATFLSVAGGLVFGWLVSAPVSIVSATVGALIVFQVIKSSFGASLAIRAGPVAAKLSQGFNADAFNYLLFLRLVPAFPFFAVNAAAALAGVSLRIFTLATLIGIIPGAFAFAWLGRGLDSIIQSQEVAHAGCVARQGASNCPVTIDLSSLVTPQLLVALCGLGLLALLPVILKKWRQPK
jgi:uncharacterized membrane protein YdjX (TVP38/TMEM64 family)